MRDSTSVISPSARTAQVALLLLVGLFALTSCTNSQKAESSRPFRQPKSYTVAQFLKTVSVLPAGISHDNQSVLFTSDSNGVPNVYRVPFSGGDPVALTQSKDSTYAISWFPRDERFLYRRDSGGNELYHVYVGSPDGNQKDLTPGEKHRALFVGWSRDKQYFYVSTNERDPKFMDVYRYTTDGYRRELIYRNPGGYELEGISPSGAWVVLSKAETTINNDLYLADVIGKSAPKIFTKHEGNASYSLQDFSFDEKTVFYSSNEDQEFTNVRGYVIPQDASTVVASNPWDIVSYEFSESGKYRLMASNEDADTVLSVEDTATRTPVALNIDKSQGTLVGLQFSPDESRALLTMSSDRSPRNLVAYEFATGESRALTQTLNPEVDPEDLVESSIVRFKASDGLEIPGPLWIPHQASADTPAPALVYVHGGPGGQTRRGYNSTIQYLVNQGYVVFGINNRGSSGYGKTFFAADDQKHGKEPLQDCVDAKAYLASLPEVDKERIGIMGGSYGGYMTLAALAFHPDVFDVGVDIFGVANWLRTLQSIPSWWEAQRNALYAELGDPEKQEDMLREISPLFHTQKIKKPLLVIQGANDPRVLKVESDEIVEQVRKNGGVAEYVVFSDEGHGFSKKENQIKSLEAIGDFLNRYLKQKGKNQA